MFLELLGKGAAACTRQNCLEKYGAVGLNLPGESVHRSARNMLVSECFLILVDTAPTRSLLRCQMTIKPRVLNHSICLRRAQCSPGTGDRAKRLVFVKRIRHDTRLYIVYCYCVRLCSCLVQRALMKPARSQRNDCRSAGSLHLRGPRLRPEHHI